VNRLKKFNILIGFMILILSTSSCTKQNYYSGISENIIEELLLNYQSEKYTKEQVLSRLGTPLIKESNGDLWIYKSSKGYGNETFRKNIYNKTLKMYFSNNVLIDFKELNL
jgi:outer membrane protein assembly factor BamE (lipoprotein component of BamABCDE complex)